MRQINRFVASALACSLLVLLASCSPQVGSEAWCNNMNEKSKGDWTTNEAAAYAKDCLF